MSNEFDLIVVGGGPAGYCAAIHAARKLKPQGGKTALVEAAELGGTCLNTGCIPTKTLIETTGVTEKIAMAAQRGVVVNGEVSFDLGKVFQYKNRVVKKMATGVAALLRENGITILDGTASVRKNGDHFSVTVTKKHENATEEFVARKIILATGSVPTMFPIPGMESPEVSARIYTSDDLLSADQLPGLPTKLAILGGGVIGVEMARVMTAFGCEAHIIEALPRLVPMLDVEISQALTKTLLARKIKITTGKKLLRIESGPPGLLLHIEGEDKPLEASHLLVAVGRSPKIDMLDAELRAALEPDRRGAIPVDGAMKTKVPGLFAPGDVNGRCMLAHAAMSMGKIAAESAVGEREAEEFDVQKVPACIYGEPEIGFIGLTEEAAREKFGDKISVGRFAFIANGRAASAGHRDGFVKVIRKVDSSQLLGVHIVGPCASELINEAAVVLTAGMSVERWADTVHGHPTFGEALIEAATDSFDAAIHLPPKQ